MTQEPEKMSFPDFVKMADELEAMGLLETVEIDPVTGEKRRQITTEGRKYLKKHRRKTFLGPLTPGPL
jgi:hypothetical protein